MHYIIHDPDDTNDSYFYYDSIAKVWSTWFKTTREVILASIEELNLEENGSPVEAICKENAFIIMVTSETPITETSHPELCL